MLVALASTVYAQQPIEYTNTDFGFSLKYPPVYKQMDSHGEALVLSSIAEEWTSKTSFDVDVYRGDSGLHTFCNNYLKNEWAHSDVFKNFKTLSKQDTLFCGLPSLIYTCTAEVPQIQKTVEWRSTFVLNNGKIFKLTLSSYPDRFAATADSTSVIFNSFRFKETLIK